MQFNLSSKHIELTDTDKELMQEKLDRIEKHLVPPFTVDVMCSHSTHHNKGDDVVGCRINITQGKKVIHAEREADTVQDALDACIKALKRELIKLREKENDFRA